MPISVLAHPTDSSPFGMLGAGGNVRDWCADAFAEEGALVKVGIAAARNSDDTSALRVCRGGSWRLGLEAAHVAVRSGLPPDVGATDVGVRLVRSL